MWNNSLQAFLVSTIVAVGVSLSGCDSRIDEGQGAVRPDVTPDKLPAAEPSKSDDNEATNAADQPDKPVQYDVRAWSDKTVEPLAIDDLEGIQAALGKVSSLDENSLDYASNPAIKYRFVSAEAPYLDIIDSEKYLELGWYYANPSDSDTEKARSHAHAKKAHTLARQLMGEEGGQLVADMLSLQVVKNKTIGGQKVELAKCEFYSCMLVLNKAAAQTDDS